jgi:membrane associated rhomboid family serine protease
MARKWLWAARRDARSRLGQVRLWVVLAALAAGIVAVSQSAGHFHLVLACFLGALCGGVWGLAMHIWHHRQIAHILRLRVLAHNQGGRFPMCPRCDLYLTGITADRCPRCGAPALASEWDQVPT